jgi:acetyl-CoA carboxylase/biotin carboxylase 1
LIAGGAAAAVIDFENEQRLEPSGHVIAARITAENPDSGFQPTSGAVTELNFRSTPDVWGYFSVDSSGRVHEFADSQIGHLFAWGASREDARQHMVLALKELSIRGDIRTTVEYLVHMMESSDFRGNRINTAWLDARISKNITAAKPDALLVAMIGAIWRSHAAYERRRDEFIGYLERGQYPPPSLLAVEDAIELIYANIKYAMHATRSGPNTITLACNGSYIQSDFRPLSDGGLLVLVGGRSHVAYAKEESTGLRLVIDGATCLFTNEYDPTQVRLAFVVKTIYTTIYDLQLRAAMSGKIARYLVDDGASVAAGSAYAEVEVMKMYMPLLVPVGAPQAACTI